MEWTFGFAAFFIDVDPLVVERCICEEIDALLVHLEEVAGAYFLAEELLEVLVTVDDYPIHIFNLTIYELQFMMSSFQFRCKNTAFCPNLLHICRFFARKLAKARDFV